MDIAMVRLGVKIIFLVTVVSTLLIFVIIRSKVLTYEGEYTEQQPSPWEKDPIHSRLQLISDKCINSTRTDYWKNKHPSGKLYTYGGITYCKTPKVGCTYWLRVLRFLAKDYTTRNGTHVLKPSDIGRHQVHYGGYKNIVVSSMNELKGSLMLHTTKSFMFTRHPLTRIWSAFIDKMLLPDFWRTFAVVIARSVRQTQKSCVSDITFEEFLEHIASTPAEHLNEHWKPVHLICSPCHTQFDVVGKQETFAQDSAYIIDKFGVEGVEEKADKNQRVKDEIEMLVKYNLGLAKGNNKDCFNRNEISKRLWLAFQLNGYIHRNISFPKELLKKDKFRQNAKAAFIERIFQAIDVQTDAMKRDLKFQKHTMMVEAYRRIPRQLLDDVVNVYKYDFELFQYDVSF